MLPVTKDRKANELSRSLSRRMDSAEGNEQRITRNCSAHLLQNAHKSLFSITTEFFMLQIILFGLAQGSVQGYDTQLKYEKFPASLSNESTTISWLQFMEEDAKDMAEMWKANNPILRGLDDSRDAITWLRSSASLKQEQHDIARLRRRRESEPASGGGSGGSGSDQTTTSVGSGLGEETTTTDIGTATTIYETSFNPRTTESDTMTSPTEGSGVEETTGPIVTLASTAVTMTGSATMTAPTEGSGMAETTVPILTTGTEGLGSTAETIAENGTITTASGATGTEDTTVIVGTTGGSGVSSAVVTITGSATMATSSEDAVETTSTGGGLTSAVATNTGSDTSATSVGDGVQATVAGGSLTSAFGTNTGSATMTTGQEPSASTLKDDITATTGTVCDTCGANEYCSPDEDRCYCEPGFTASNDGTCIAAKQFGGKLYMDEPFNISLENASSDLYISYVNIYTEFLKVAYSQESWFLSVRVTGFSNGSTIVEYELATEDVSTVNSSTVQDAFAAFLGNESYFANCSCSANTCQPQNLSTDTLVIAQVSCEDAGRAVDVVCAAPGVSTFCNSNSTTCTADLDGNVICECNDGFSKGNSSRECALITVTVCSPSTNSGCNSPYGTCLETPDGAGRCSCMWGFEGAHCQEAWLFILVIVLSALIFIALIAGAVFLWRRKRRRKGWKSSAEEISYRNDDRYSSTDGYKSLSEWDVPVRGIIATYYKAKNVNEAYDDVIITNQDARDGNENGKEARGGPQLPLEQWRVSELGNGERIRTEGARDEPQLPLGQWRVSELGNGERIRTENLGYELDCKDHSYERIGKESVESEDVTTRI